MASFWGAQTAMQQLSLLLLAFGLTSLSLAQPPLWKIHDVASSVCAMSCCAISICPTPFALLTDLPARTYHTQGEIAKSRITVIILGSVLGSVLLLPSLALALFLLRRRRQRAQRSKVISASVTPFSSRAMEHIVTVSGAIVAMAPEHRRMQSAVISRTDHSGYSPDSSAGSTASSIVRPTRIRVQSHDCTECPLTQASLPREPRLVDEQSGSVDHYASAHGSTIPYSSVCSTRLSIASVTSSVHRPLPSIPPGQLDTASREDAHTVLDRKMRHMGLYAITEAEQTEGSAVNLV